jgi:hypothetical protein
MVTKDTELQLQQELLVPFANFWLKHDTESFLEIKKAESQRIHAI